MEIDVRRYRESDEDVVVELWHRTGLHRPWLHLRAEIHEMCRHDGSLFLVAESDGAIAGAVMGAYDGRRGWIYHLAVEPALQGHGIGRILLEEIERRMIDRGIVKVNLQVRADNLDVLGFYEHLGYENAHLESLNKWLIPPPQEMNRKPH